MQPRICAVVWIRLLVLSLAAALTVGSATAQREKVLYSLPAPTGLGTGAQDPSLSVVFDPAGNLYGVAQVSGTFAEGPGGIFQVTPQAGGGWSGSVIFNFTAANAGVYPNAGLVTDSASNLYGTTYQGGTYNGGVVFELSHNAHGWTEKILHAFGKTEADGVFPEAGVTFDNAGNLYGTASGGGAHDAGIAFKLTPQAGGTWSEQILYNFGASSTDGSQPSAKLMVDSSGNIYGSTVFGGTDGGGTAFKLIPQTGRGAIEKILHSFPSESQPRSALVFDTAGNLYGTTSTGGIGWGSVFELSPQTDGSWTETDIHQFQGLYDGFNAMSGVVFDAHGNLYGATLSGGRFGGRDGYGTIYKLAPVSGGGWTESTIFNFDAADGAGPSFGSLTFDASGNFYGATQGGGPNGYGAVFEITP